MGNDILITPGNALINFSGTSAGNINLQVQGDGRVSFIGISSGAEQLTIIDSLSGSVFTVNNSFGSPILDINFDNTITMPYGASDGYVLTSDAVGDASWQPSGGGTFTGNTSGDCITDLYITNLYGCSPITVHDSIQHISSSATGINSIAWGIGTTASGYAAHAEGAGTIASGTSSHAEGEDGTTASGVASHAEGSQTLASGYASHAEGFFTTASGYAAHAEGLGNIASGEGSHAEGGIDNESNISPTSATTYSAHAEGLNTLASGWASHAEGWGSIASAASSHAQGANTLASGGYAHAEGQFTTASGTWSHTEGRYTIADGDYSHAGGASSIALGTTSFIHSTNSLVTGFRSVVLGGINITGATDDTVYVPNLNINTASIDNGLPNILVRDPDGTVKYRAASSLSGGTPFSWSDPVITLGNTSGDCITNLYVSNLHGCSPITIHTPIIITGSTTATTTITSTGINTPSLTVGGQPFSASCQTLFIKKSFVPSQISGLTTPFEMIPAPGAGKAIQIIAANARKIYGTTPYNTVGFILKYSGTTCSGIGDIQFCRWGHISGLMGVAFIGDTYGTFSRETAYENSWAPNVSVTLHATGAPGLAGDSSLDIYITYKIITL